MAAGNPGDDELAGRVFDGDITLRMEEEGNRSAQLVRRPILVRASSIKMNWFLQRAEVPHSPFPDGEAFAYRFDTN